MAIGEHFMHQGRDVLLVIDDLTRHARAYRELSLLLRRPPGREANAGDIFYLHSRLLERSTHLKDSLGGGSLYQPLPVAEQIAALVAVNEGVLDNLAIEDIGAAERKIRRPITEDQQDLSKKIDKGENLDQKDIDTIRQAAESALNRNQRSDEK